MGKIGGGRGKSSTEIALASREIPFGCDRKQFFAP